VSALASALYEGSVVHARLDAPKRTFRYPLFLTLLDVDELDEVDRRLRLIGHNRPRVVTFRDSDHLGEHGRSVRENLERLLLTRSVTPPGGRIRILTHCRIFGYVFNPVSFFYCDDSRGRTAVVVAEVNNTFGERYPYVLTVRDDTWTWVEKKLMHVSPFFSLEGSYRFHLPPPGEQLSASVDLTRAGRTVLAARLSLSRRPLTDRSLASALIRFPFMTLKVIGAIHAEAFRLWLKKATVHHKPPYDPEAARGELP
jgi:DUF1365 family protein